MVRTQSRHLIAVTQDRFIGRTAIVTGAASWLRLETARLLATEGAQVAIWHVSDVVHQLTGLENVHVEKLDISSEADVEAGMARSVAALGGKLDILVSSAGISGPNVVLRDFPADDWRRVFDINANGTFFVNREKKITVASSILHRSLAKKVTPTLRPTVGRRRP